MAQSFLSAPVIWSTSTIQFIIVDFFEVASFNTCLDGGGGGGGHNYKHMPLTVNWSIS